MTTHFAYIGNHVYQRAHLFYYADITGELTGPYLTLDDAMRASNEFYNETFSQQSMG